MDPNLTATDVERLLADRENGGFPDYTNDLLSFVSADYINAYLAETSSYFQLKVVVQIDTVRVTYYSVLYRENQGGATVPILRSFGTL